MWAGSQHALKGISSNRKNKEIILENALGKVILKYNDISVHFVPKNEHCLVRKASFVPIKRVKAYEVKE